MSKNKKGVNKNIENNSESKPENGIASKNLDASLKKLMAAGKVKGFLTFDEVNKLLPADLFSPDIIDGALNSLSEAGVNILEVDSIVKEEEFDLAVDDEFDVNEEGSEVEAVEEVLIGITDDPVRQYLKDMGGVRLLSREDEIVIAKRIEEGRNSMIASLCETPLAMKKFIALF